MASTLPKAQCAMCSSPENLSRCAACKVVQYCSRSHQVGHRPIHKGACTRVRKTREALQEAESELRAKPPDFALPANVFETMAGHFWGILDTRDYMRARFSHVDALLQVKTAEAVQTALDHLMDIHRLNRSDNMGLRDYTPFVLLRLGKDQQSYDFLKWHATTGRDSHYDWGNMDLPYLDIKDADVFEDVSPYIRKFLNLSHAVAVMLIKIRLLKDLQALQNSSVVGDKVPAELLDNIRGQLVSTIVANNKEIMEEEDLSPRIQQLQLQIDQLYRAVKKDNQHFWPALLEPGRHLTARPEYTSRGEVSEMQLVLQQSYDAWAETPGAIEIIRAKAP